MGINVNKSKFILEKMFNESLDKKATDNLLHEVKAKRWVRLNAVAYIANKLKIRIRDGGDSSDDDDVSPRSKKEKKDSEEVTNQNMGLYLREIKKRKERALPVCFLLCDSFITSIIVVVII